MIAFGCASSDERRFRAGAAKAIEGAADADSLLMRRQMESPAESYAAMLAEAAEEDDLEGFALVDQSVSRLDGNLITRLRAVLEASPDIAVVGSAPFGGLGEVEWVVGPLVVLSAWAVRELRLDASVSGALDPLAMDLCFQARARGRCVVASDAIGTVGVAASHLLRRERRDWLHSTVAVRRKWGADGAVPIPSPFGLDYALPLTTRERR